MRTADICKTKAETGIQTSAAKKSWTTEAMMMDELQIQGLGTGNA
jgi:hypothetical protein